jgi:hypothetical protein
MSKDHYVARTYLRHFADSDGKLHVYWKGDGKYRARSPKSVCHEWDGDLIRDFVKDEEMLGKYRAIFEPRWNDAITDLGNGICDAAVKMAIAGYWANLLVCTPAWTRLGVKMLDYNTVHHLRVQDALRTRAGKPDAKIKAILAVLDAGRIRIETEPDAVRAMAATKLMKFAWGLYNANWTVIRNRTGTGFISSDNPVAFDDPGPWRGGQPGLPRYLTLSPTLCIYGAMDPREPRDEPDFTRPPSGEIQWGSVPLEGVERVNRAVAQCAEEIVVSSRKSTAVEALVAECARHRVDMEFFEIQQPDGFILGNHTRVREQPGGTQNDHRQ